MYIFVLRLATTCSAIIVVTAHCGVHCTAPAKPLPHLLLDNQPADAVMVLIMQAISSSWLLSSEVSPPPSCARTSLQSAANACTSGLMSALPSFGGACRHAQNTSWPHQLSLCREAHIPMSSPDTHLPGGACNPHHVVACSARKHGLLRQRICTLSEVLQLCCPVACSLLKRSGCLSCDPLGTLVLLCCGLAVRVWMVCTVHVLHHEPQEW